MAQRATGFAKKPPTSRTNRVESPRSAGNSPVELRPVPLNLIPLVAPYKKKGRLSIRIERLPKLARLSAGRNKGDGNWSLASDELEDLVYLVPETVREAHTLGIRLIALDGEAGSTLALLDYVVSPGPVDASPIEQGTHEQAALEDEPEPTVAGAGAGDLALLQRLRGELAAAKTKLEEPESAKAPEPAPAAPEPATQEKYEAKLAAARLVWKAELDERLATAALEHKAELAKAHAEWEAEHATRKTKGDKVEAEVAKARNVWKAELDSRLAEAAVQARAELSKARAAWEDQFAKARDEWEAERDGLLARQAQDASEKIESAESGLKDELARVRTAWQAELDARLAEARANASAELSSARETWEAERNAQVAKLAKTESAKGKMETELSAARAAWKTELEERLADAATDAAALLARAKASWEAEEQARAAKAAESALAELVQVREAAQRESQEALAKAEEAWKAAEAERAAAAEAAADMLREKALAAAHADALAERKALEENEIKPLQEKVAQLEASLNEREAALAKAAIDGDETRRIWQRETEEKITRAEEAARNATAAGDAKLSSAEAQWKLKSDRDQTAAETLLDEANRALAAAKEQAEADLADAKAKADAELLAQRARSAADAVEVRGKAEADMKALRDRIEELDATIIERDRLHEAGRAADSAAYQRVQAEWKAQIDKNNEEADTRYKRQYSGALADATSRYEAAESALALLRHKAARTNTDHNENLEVLRLRDEVSAMQLTLAARERELVELRGYASPGDAAPEPNIPLRTNQAWQAAEAAEQARGARTKRRRNMHVFASIVVVAAAVGGVLYFMGGSDAPAPVASTAGVPAVGEGETHMRVQAMATVTGDSNVRSGPSSRAAVAGSVRRGMKVAIVERRQNWIQIRLPAAGGKPPVEGWVHKSRLREDAPTRASAPE